MNTTAQRISLWITPFFGGVLFIAVLAFPGFWPPMSPQLTADQVAEFYRHNSTMIRFSMITLNLCAIMLVPFFMVIVVQMKRMATPSTVLAYSYLAAVSTGATMFAIADIFWLVAAFRPDRDPQLTMLLNDFAWLIFVAPVGFVVVANLVLALAVWLDARSEPVFDRWVVWVNLVAAAAMTPAVGSVIVQSGPFAWDGVVSFWLRWGGFVVYLVLMFVAVHGAIRRQRAEETLSDKATAVVAS